MEDVSRIQQKEGRKRQLGKEGVREVIVYGRLWKGRTRDACTVDVGGACVMGGGGEEVYGNWRR